MGWSTRRTPARVSTPWRGYLVLYWPCFCCCFMYTHLTRNGLEHKEDASIYAEVGDGEGRHLSTFSNHFNNINSKYQVRKNVSLSYFFKTLLSVLTRLFLIFCRCLCISLSLFLSLAVFPFLAVALFLCLSLCLSLSPSLFIFSSSSPILTWSNFGLLILILIRLW